MPVFAALEAGGSKFVCGLGSGPDDLVTTQIPTTTPAETVARCVEFFRSAKVDALGIGSFGPIDRARGVITSTPKTAWRGFNLLGAFVHALDVPVVIDTDVNAALTGEARWGAARGVANCLYLTVGTGIGGAAQLDGRMLQGAGHPEMGHMRIPRHRADGGFGGVCPYHGDCLEGLASGPAIAARCRQPVESLPDDDAVWEVEAYYLGVAVANLACALSLQQVIVGGGVMQRAGLLVRIRSAVSELINSYVAVPEIVLPGLGDRAGVLGALALVT
jgi:fructokinase